MIMDPSSEREISNVASIIQKSQQHKIFVSAFHVEAGAKALNVQIKTLESALQFLGCHFWTGEECDGMDNTSLPSVPTSLTERWTIFLQFGHYFSPFLQASHPKWAKWLNPYTGEKANTHDEDEAVDVIVDSLVCLFDAAETVVENTLNLLRRKGFSDPSFDHVAQYARKNNDYNMVQGHFRV